MSKIQSRVQRAYVFALERIKDRDRNATQPLPVVKRKRRKRMCDVAPELYDKTVLRELKQALTDEYGEICMRCGCDSQIVMDHIISRFKGGTNDRENLQLLCSPCNFIKISAWRLPDLSGRGNAVLVLYLNLCYYNYCEIGC